MTPHYRYHRDPFPHSLLSTSQKVPPLQIRSFLSKRVPGLFRIAPLCCWIFGCTGSFHVLVCSRTRQVLFFLILESFIILAECFLLVSDL